MSTASQLAAAPPVVVLGDVMLDLYVSGRVGRISPEAPVPVLSEVSERAVAGGAANVALNIASLGGRVRLIGRIGADEGGRRLAAILQAAGIGPGAGTELRAGVGVGAEDGSGDAAGGGDSTGPGAEYEAGPGAGQGAEARTWSCSDLLVDPEASTILKTRILAGAAHQFLRIDRETLRPPDSALIQRLMACLEAALEGAGALAISDYGKGLLSDAMLAGAIDLARAKGVPVLVDPKRPDFSAYAGAQVIKPNLAELSAASGRDCADPVARAEAVRAVAARTGADLLLTMSDKGMAYYPADGGAPVHLPARAREVFDVSGAGDTVLALFAAMRATGAGVERAMHVANVAAGIVVSKAGTATLTGRELDAALAREALAQEASARETPGGEDPVGEGRFAGGGTVTDLAGARALCARWRAAGLQVGFTNGCFDLIHPGHVRILHGARGACDRLVVGLNTDASVRRLKGPARPIQAEAARAEVLAALSGVDAVVLFDEDTPLELIRALEPDVLVKGADYAQADIVGAAEVMARGGRVERVALVAGQSTSALVARSGSGAGNGAGSARGAELGADSGRASVAGSRPAEADE